MGAVCPSQKWLTQGFDTYWVSVIDHAVKEPFYNLDRFVLETNIIGILFILKEKFS